MPTAAADSYSVPSGASLYAGIDSPVPNDVASNVWTPTKNAAGNIRSGSWANLPLNEWCKVGGTRFQQLDDALQAGGFVPSSHIRGSNKDVMSGFNTYVGGVLMGNSFLVPNGGGHDASSLNMTARLDLERMGGGAGWVVEHFPSRPDEAGFEWDAGYVAGFTQYPGADPLGDGLYRDILPNGKPTSRHQYNGVWADTSRNVIGISRVSKWVLDRNTNSWSRNRWRDGASSTTDTVTTIHAQLYYDSTRDEVFGHFSFGDNDSFSWGYCQASGRNIVNVSGPANFAAKSAIASSRLNGNRVLVTWANGGDRWGIYDNSTRTWDAGSGGLITSGLVGTPNAYDQELQVLCYVPDWGKALRRWTWASLQGVWRTFDVAAAANESYSPAGIEPPFSTWPGNKCFYYPDRKCVVYITANSLSVDAVYVMRTG